MLKPSTLTRFWSLIDIGEEDDCWIWNGRLNSSGYGDYTRSSQRITAHRMAYLLSREIDSLPSHMHVHHLCGQRRCCNPHHLVVERDHTAHAARHFSERSTCRRGHLYETGSYYVKANGTRTCRPCREAVIQERAALELAEVLARLGDKSSLA